MDSFGGTRYSRLYLKAGAGNPLGASNIPHLTPSKFDSFVNVFTFYFFRDYSYLKREYGRKAEDITGSEENAGDSYEFCFNLEIVCVFSGN